MSLIEMSIHREVNTSLESDKHELRIRTQQILEAGYPGASLLPGDLGRLACQIAGVDQTFPPVKNRHRRTRTTFPQTFQEAE